MRSDLIELEVCVHGKPIREYPHQGKFWIEGRKGSPYTLRVRNRSRGRLLLTMSVDGLSVMTGKPASKNDGGYILGWGETLNLPGWYLNDQEVAKFVFSKDKGSYAAKMGQDVINLGIIGCAVFTEKPDPYSRILRGQQVNCPKKTKREMSYQADWQVTPSSTFTSTVGGSQLDCMTEISCNVSQEVASVEQEIGTGFGKSQEFVTRTATFNKASSVPNETVEIRYDSRQNLKKRGIDLDRKPVTAKEPSAFPADVGCQPPPDWRG